MTLPLTDTQKRELVEAGPGLVGVPVPTVPCEGTLQPYSHDDGKRVGLRCDGGCAGDKTHPATPGETLDPRWVRLAADTCTTCDGIGVRYIDKHGAVWGNTLAAELGLTETITCPDCFEGSPWHPITTECDECRGRGSVWADESLDDLGNLSGHTSTPYGDLDVESLDCDNCDGKGRVTVGRLAIATLAPCEEGDLRGTPRPVLHKYESDYGTWFYLYAENGDKDTHVHRFVGTPQPGVMIAILQVETP